MPPVWIPIAPEIIVDEDGQEYISSIVNDEGIHGIRLAKLRWEADEP